MGSTAGARASEANQLRAPKELALVHLTIGARFVWIFFENLGKGLYTPAGCGKNQVAMTAPLQGVIEFSLGLLLVVGLLTRQAGLVAVLVLGSLRVSEWGTTWIWELRVPVLASLGLAIGRAGRRWGIDVSLSQRCPSSPWW